MGFAMRLDGRRAFIGKAPVRGHAVDRVRQVLTELRQEIMRLHAGLARHALHPILAKHGLQLLRRHRLVLAVADPGLCDVAEASLLELRDQAAEASSSKAAHHASPLAGHPRAALLTSAKHVHQHALNG